MNKKSSENRIEFIKKVLHVTCNLKMPNLNNNFGLQVCLSFHAWVCTQVKLSDFKSHHKMLLIKVPQYVLRVKNMHFGSPSDSRNPYSKAKLSFVYYIIMQGEAKLHVQNSLQCFITSLVLFPNSCVLQHTQDVLAKWVLPNLFQIKNKSLNSCKLH